MGYAPAEDPQIAIYVVVDRPNVAQQDDAKHATRLVRSILTEVLPYLNIFMTEELTEAEIEELRALNLEIIMAANAVGSVSGNTVVSGEELPTEETEGSEGRETQEEPVTDARGGDITSSISVEEDVGETAPLTGVLLDPATGEAKNPEGDDDSPR